ncbi:MAG: hypothetical protein H6R15_3930 [Proteobacteria bacterium]|nr:hypothetical protein [Pseudomonadota bacterium]
MNEFPWLGASFALLILFFAVFMIAKLGKNIIEEKC